MRRTTPPLAPPPNDVAGFCAAIAAADNYVVPWMPSGADGEL
jgi:hypothetical protein